MNSVRRRSLSWKPQNPPTAMLLGLLILLGLLLRTLLLGNTFQTSDNVKLALKIVTNPGIEWMFSEPYGLLINILVLIFASVASILGISINEFIWKLPVALLGTLQIPLTFFFLKRLKLSSAASLLGSFLLAILPIHVMQSRYLWGYEILGTFFLTLAVWSLINYFEDPSASKARMTGLLSGLYLISHGFILPFIPSLGVLALLYTDRRNPEHRQILKKSLPQFVGLLLLFLPFTIPALAHIGERETQLGIYILDHDRGFIGDIGLFLPALLLALTGLQLAERIRPNREIVLFALLSFFYSAPLFFGVPPRATVIRGYMLIGIYFLVLLIMVLVEARLQKGTGWIIPVVILCGLGTLWGTVESIFLRDRLFDPSLVIIERGDTLPDPGSKTAGYLLRKYIPPSVQVLALHRSLEPENFIYYAGRAHFAFNDLSLEETIEKLHEFKNTSQVVICDEEQWKIIEAEKNFRLNTVIYSEHQPRMWIFTRDGIALPVSKADVADFNPVFDDWYSPHPAWLSGLVIR